MRWRYTIAAGLLFVALLAWVLTQERSRVAEEGELFGLDAKVATRLEVKREGQDDLVLEKRGEQWYLVSPIEGLADEDEVMRMVKAVAQLKPSESRDGADLGAEAFGLAQPDLIAILHYGSGQTAQVSLGAETPIGAGRFAKVEGRDRLFIVPASVRTDLSREPDKLRQKKLARFETEDVKAIRLQHGTELVAATRVSQGPEPQWRLSQPLATSGDEWGIKQLINKVKDMQAEDFLKEEHTDAELGLDKPQVTVALTLNDGTELTVTVGKQSTRKVGDTQTEKQVLFVRSSQRGEVLLVAADVLEGLTRTAFDLRNKSIVQVKRDDILRVKVERKQGLNFSLARRPSGWIVEQPKIADASQSKVDNLLWDIEDLSAKSFVSEDAGDQELRTWGLVVPSNALTITVRGQDQPIRIFLGEATEDGDYYCMTSQSRQVFTVSKFLVDDLPETEEELKSSPTDMTPEFPAPGEQPTF